MKQLLLKCPNPECGLYNKEHTVDLDWFLLKVWNPDYNQMKVYPGILDFSKINHLQCVECFRIINAEIKEWK